MVDFLIVGQGLAGTVLARTLEKRGHTVHVIEGALAPSASRVAAGVWNPIVVKRFTKSWLAEESVAAASDFYQNEENFFTDSFFFKNTLNKLLSNESELLQKERRWKEMLPFVEASPIQIAGVEAPHGYLHVKDAGYFNVPKYLNNCRDYWLSRGIWRQSALNYQDLIKRGDDWQWGGEDYRKVVFCEGISGLKNPYLATLPIQITKGEVLEVRIAGLEMSGILNKQIFILPLGNTIFRVGATNEWDYADLDPSETGKEELLQKLAVIIPEKKIEVLRHEAGGRPTTKDRRPLMGALSENGLYVFNGLGSRGVLLAPYLSECLSKFFDGDETAIPAEASINRFIKR